MAIQTTLGNAEDPEKGEFTLWFPIEPEKYEALIQDLNVLGMGDAIKRDCLVLEILGWPVLKQLEGHTVNLDELDYLAKRLDNFSGYALSQFETMAYKLELTDIKDLINLTFCCDEVTVITNFADTELYKIGRNHILRLHGGAMPQEEYRKLNGREETLRMIRNNEGTITPYGVVYDNGMTMAQLYNGRQLPYDTYRDSLLTLELAPKEGIQEGNEPEYVYLPAPDDQIKRAMLRGGIDPMNCEGTRISTIETYLPGPIADLLEQRNEDIGLINAFCHSLSGFDEQDMFKLYAVFESIKPKDVVEIQQLAENLDQFVFVEDVTTLEEYGRYLIQKSGKFQYDPALEQCYDYELCGKKQVEADGGQFNDYGYVAYCGTLSLDDLMWEGPTEKYQQEQSF